MNERLPGIFLLAAVFVIATCGPVYELIAATLSSYLVGSSVTHFSIVIGIFLTAMGLGSYLTRFVKRDLIDTFVLIQIGIGLSGGLSAAILLAAFVLLETYLPILTATLTVTGTLVGMEIPLLIRILKSRAALSVTVSNVLALDYVGALAASCAFPILFVPHLGLLRASLIFGLLNIAVAAVALRVLGSMLRRPRRLRGYCAASGLILTAGLAGSGVFTSLTEDMLYQDDIIIARQSKFQRLVVTRWHDDVRLYIDGNLQLSSVDEHRYHESLVHPAAAATPAAKRALILGGGDGMAAREVLKYRNIERIDLVDLDPMVISLFKDRPLLAQLSGNALSNPRVKIHTMDAEKFLAGSNESWDLIFLDLPDPNNLSLGRLYSKSFYRLLAKHLSVNGIAVTQATSPFYAPQAFWCIVETVKLTQAGPEPGRNLNVYPYHVHVPSFGDWGFVMATRRKLDPNKLALATGIEMKFLNNRLLPGLFAFPKDSLTSTPVQTNRLDDQALVKYYRKGWRRFGP